MEAPREQSCWSGFYNISLCYRQQLAQTYHYTLTTNFAPEYAANEDYELIELMHEQFLRHLNVEDLRRTPAEEHIFNARLSTGLITSLEEVLERGETERLRDMAMLARVVDCFFVKKKPAAGLRNIIQTYYSEG